MRNRNLQAKMDQFVPGLPDDPAHLPTLLYQVLEGRVFTLLEFPDDSAARGEIKLAELEAALGAPVKEEGWYSATGTYLGAHPPRSLVR